MVAACSRTRRRSISKVQGGAGNGGGSDDGGDGGGDDCGDGGGGGGGGDGNGGGRPMMLSAVSVEPLMSAWSSVASVKSIVEDP